MNQGDLVIVRAFRHRPLLRVAWEENEVGILVCKQEEYEWATRQGEDPDCSGFPKEDVFRYDPRLWERLHEASAQGDTSQLEALWVEAPTH
jgi:hypothetical protein